MSRKLITYGLSGLLSLFLLASCSDDPQGQAKKKGQELWFDEYVHDYGQIELESDGSWTFTFKNIGENAIIINRVRRNPAKLKIKTGGSMPYTLNPQDFKATISLSPDNRKKVTLSGHTDAKGSDEYNSLLSKCRAKAVKAYLKAAGIDDSQIVTRSYGFTKPRRPDTKDDGTDDPSARRANRRTEIYLDF